MIKIIIPKRLRDDILKTFKKDSLKIFKLINTLKENPSKGKIIGPVGVMSLRELKFKNYRFYFIINGHQLILFTKQETEKLLIRFINMSTKNKQQKTIDHIKEMLSIIQNK